MFWTPRHDDGYPLDLDGAERQTRYSNAKWQIPLPPVIGCVSGFSPQLDFALWRSHIGKMPSGPGATTLPDNLAWQINIPALAKVGGKGR